MHKNEKDKNCKLKKKLYRSPRVRKLKLSDPNPMCLIPSPTASP